MPILGEGVLRTAGDASVDHISMYVRMDSHQTYVGQSV